MTEVNPPQQRHLQVVAGLRGVPDILLGAREHVECPEQVLAREPRCERLQSVGIGREFRVREARRVHADDHQVAHQAGELTDDQLEVQPRLHEPAHGVEHVGHAPIRDDLGHVHQHVSANQPEHRRDVGGGDAIAGKRDHLIEGAQRVAHAAFARTREQKQGVWIGLDLLGLRDVPQLVGDAARADRAQLEFLRPRTNRLRDLVQLRRRHHEDDVRRRLLDRLEERVEGLLGQCMALHR